MSESTSRPACELGSCRRKTMPTPAGFAAGTRPEPMRAGAAGIGRGTWPAGGDCPSPLDPPQQPSGSQHWHLLKRPTSALSNDMPSPVIPRTMGWGGKPRRQAATQALRRGYSGLKLTQRRFSKIARRQRDNALGGRFGIGCTAGASASEACLRWQRCLRCSNRGVSSLSSRPAHRTAG